MQILIVRLGALGDIVHAVPAVAALRRALPEARIDWVVERRHREVVDLVAGLRRRVSIDTSRWSSLVPGIRALRSARYDIAIDLQGLLKSAVLARLSGARRVVGFDRSALREPAAALFYRERHETDDRQHIIRKNLSLARVVAAVDDRIEFPLDVSGAEPQPGPYALLNPGAAWPNKRWPPARFGAVAAAIRKAHGLRTVVVWGPGERALAGEVVEASACAALVSPPTTIQELAAVARSARLMISGDTGPLHVAAAVGTPIVALFGPTRPERNGPWAAGDIVVSRVARCACVYERRCRRGDPCIDDIGVDEVVDAVARRLAAPRVTAGA